MHGNLTPSRIQLRQATRAAHDQLESTPIMCRILTPVVALTDYVALLQILYRAEQQLGPAIESGLGELCCEPLQVTQLLTLLESDLRELDAWPVPAPELEPPLGLDSPEHCLGAWYVLEGSALGGDVIAQHLRSTIGADLPTSYLAGRPGFPEPRWQLFTDHLDQMLLAPERLAPVVDGALQAYAYLAAALELAD